MSEKTYNFDTEARLVCNAIGSDVGHMTVMCALREAYEAGRKGMATSGFAPRATPNKRTQTV